MIVRLVLITVLAFAAWPRPGRAATSLEAGWMSTTERADAANAVTPRRALRSRRDPPRPAASWRSLSTPDSPTPTAEVGSAGAVLDLDLAHAAQLGAGGAWTSRVGTTLLAGAGEGGGGMAAGFNAGLGLASAPSARRGHVRADLGYRLLFSRERRDS